MCERIHNTSSYRTSVWWFFTRLFGRIRLIIGHTLDTANAQANILFKYKDGGSTGVMGFQFLCVKTKKGWKRKCFVQRIDKGYLETYFQAVLVKDTLSKGSGKNKSVAKNWILLYFLRVENEFSAERSLPKTFCNTRDIPDIWQLFGTCRIGWSGPSAEGIILCLNNSRLDKRCLLLQVSNEYPVDNSSSIATDACLIIFGTSLSLYNWYYLKVCKSW